MDIAVAQAGRSPYMLLWSKNNLCFVGCCRPIFVVAAISLPFARVAEIEHYYFGCLSASCLANVYNYDLKK
jgi:hypothetical protein